MFPARMFAKRMFTGRMFLPVVGTVITISKYSVALPQFVGGGVGRAMRR